MEIDINHMMKKKNIEKKKNILQIKVKWYIQNKI